MTNLFAITAATNKVTLDKKRQGEIAFTVSNTSDRPLRGRALIMPPDGMSAELFILEGEAERDFALAGTQQYTVQIALPPKTEAGTHVFQLNMVGVANPDEEFAEGPTVTFEVAEVEKEKRKIPWWIFLVIALVIFGGGTAAYLLLSNRPPELSVITSTEAETAVAGTNLIYTVTISNTGKGAATDIILTETLPSGTSFVSAAPDDCVAQEADSLVTCQLEESIPANKSHELEMVVALDSSTRGTISNTTTLLSNEIISTTNPISATQLFTVTAEVSLVATLAGPASIQADSDLVYNALVTNSGPSQATDVTMTYVQPEGVLSVAAASATENCDQAEGVVTCSLGELDPGIGVPITITVQPGPAVTGEMLEGMVTVTSTEAEEAISTERVQTQIESGNSLAVSVESAEWSVVGDNLTYAINVWNESTEDANNVEVRYTVPANLIYVRSTPTCDELKSGDVLTLICKLGTLPASSDDVQSVVIELEPTAEGSISSDIRVVSTDFPDESRSWETNVAKAFSSTGLRFDGRNDWVELTDFDVPESFTVEMWINPESANNQQSFVGKHTAGGGNIFLVGYWEDGVYVNIRDETYVAGNKPTGLYHLAVVVEKRTLSQSFVTVYKDGEVFWEHEFASVLGNDISGNAWVLGQDWDGETPTDFFNGAMTEVRLWDGARSQAEIQALINQRLTGSEDGLLGYWPLNEVAGQEVADWADNERNGRILNGPIWVGAQVPEDFGTALAFDGIDDYVRIPDDDAIDFGTNQDFTVEFRVLASPLQAFTNYSDNDIVEKWGFGSDGTIGGYPYVIRYLNQTAGSNNGLIVAARYDQASNPSVVSTTRVNDGQFHHIAFVKSGNMLYLYVDGILEDSSTDVTSAPTINSSPLYLGQRGDNLKNFFTGAIDELRIWNTPRSQTQIQANMEQPLRGDEVGLVAYWRFDEGSGERTFDLSGNGIDATIVGPTWMDIPVNSD